MARESERLNPEEEARTGRTPEPVIFLSVGEASGDLHGAALARALRARIPGVRLVGLGGDHMRREGVELLADIQDLAVMGVVEVLSRLPFLLRLRRRVYSFLDSAEVDLVIPLDYPGFNLRLAKHARASGRKVLYYIAPQVWAWHASRAESLARDADRVAVILPFEERFLTQAGAKAEFVGHPLIERKEEVIDRATWFAKQGLDEKRPLLALMPGSRRQEISRHLRLFTEAAERVREAVPEVQAMIGAPPGIPDESYASSPITRTRDSQNLLRFATAALVKSGTTTLEAALAGTPLVVAYRMNPVSFRIARRLVRVPHIALANLVGSERIVPEFVQNDATPEALAATLVPLLRPGEPSRELMVTKLGRVREALGERRAAARVAEMAADLLEIE